MNNIGNENTGVVQKHDMATNTDEDLIKLTSDEMAAAPVSGSQRERSLFIGGMCSAISERDLRIHFSQYGLIVKVFMKFDVITGLSRDYAFILFSDEEAVKRAIDVQEHVIWGRKLSARRAKCRNNRIFVSGLPWVATEDEIRRYFARFGDISDFQVPYNWQNSHRRSYCFISFISDQAVQDLLSIEHHTMRGRTLIIKRAMPRTERPLGASNGFISHTYNNNWQSVALHAQQLAWQTTWHTLAPNNNNNNANANAAAGDSYSANNYANAAAAINNNMSYHYMPYQQVPPANGSGDCYAQYPYVDPGAVTWQLNQPLAVAAAAATPPNAYGGIFANNNNKNFLHNGNGSGSDNDAAALMNNISNPIAPMHCINNYTTGGGLCFGPELDIATNANDTVDAILGVPAGDAKSNNNDNAIIDWEMLDLSHSAPNHNYQGFFEGNNYISNLNANASNNNNTTNKNIAANDNNNNTTNKNIAGNDNNNNNNAENNNELN